MGETARDRGREGEERCTKQDARGSPEGSGDEDRAAALGNTRGQRRAGALAGTDGLHLVADKRGQH